LASRAGSTSVAVHATNIGQQIGMGAGAEHMGKEASA
jgi:hypothetical protein